jgi:hypothetical protein
MRYFKFAAKFADCLQYGNTIFVVIYKGDM